MGYPSRRGAPCRKCEAASVVNANPHGFPWLSVRAFVRGSQDVLSSDPEVHEGAMPTDSRTALVPECFTWNIFWSPRVR